MLNQREGLCFVIGPMGDSAAERPGERRLERLASQVLRPIFDEIRTDFDARYQIETPFDIQGITGDSIDDKVIYKIDRADIIVADLTDGNPNVFYELGLCHALGRATILVLETGTDQNIQFYVSKYDVVRVSLRKERDGNPVTPDYDGARQALRGSIRNAYRQVNNWRNFNNPVVNFFRAPITYISPAFSLAQGYYENFVRRIGEAILRPEGRYRFDIGFALSKKDGNQEEVTDILPPETRRKIKLLIVVPLRLSYTGDLYVERLNGRLREVYVETESRTRTGRYAEIDGQPYIVDIPTTIRMMVDAVERRLLSDPVNRQSPEYQEIEEQEVERFIANLRYSFIDRHRDNPEFSERIEIVQYDPENPGDDLRWFDDIMKLR